MIHWRLFGLEQAMLHIRTLLRVRKYSSAHRLEEKVPRIEKGQFSLEPIDSLMCLLLQYQLIMAVVCFYSTDNLLILDMRLLAALQSYLFQPM